MRLTVFQSGKGDSMLLTGADGRRVLVDGTVSDAYNEHVAPALAKLREKGEVLDVVYLSHIDDDHIGGVLKLMNDEIDWRIHDFQLKSGNTKHKAPKVPRPPEVKAIWHNAFHDLLKDNTGEIESMIAATATILSGSEHEAVQELVSQQNELVTSISQSIKLTKRVSPDQLGIKLNQPAKGKLMLVRPSSSAPIRVGGMRFRLIGPFSEDLKKLRQEWNKWLRENQKQLGTIRTKAKKDEASFGTKEIDDILLPKLDQADALSSLLPLDGLTAAAFKLGDRKKVTTPNLASLMFFVEEKGRTLLLTGDGHQGDILKGLKHIKKLTAKKGLHVNVLKVQHHGSEFNIDEEFCRTVTADHYVFCGNGEHKNPDLRALQAIIDSRVGKAEQLSPNAEVGNPFKFWINNHSSLSPNAAAKSHMKGVEKLVTQAAAKSKGKMTSFFLKGSSFDLEI